MSPQLENGYTRIADEILEKVALTKLNGTQFRILLIVWRCTYGWQKKEHDLSIDYLSKATGINKRQVQRELAVLFDKGILVEIQAPTFNKARIIGFNKAYQISEQVTKKTPLVELDTHTDGELDTSTGDELDTQNKDINKQIKYKGVFDYYMTLGLKKHRNYTDDMRDAMKYAERVLKLNEEDMKLMLKRHAEKVEATKGNEYPVRVRGITEFFSRKKYQSKVLICADYLDENYEVQPGRSKEEEAELERKRERVMRQVNGK